MNTSVTTSATTRPVDLLDYPAGQWRDLLAEVGAEPYRGSQVAQWVFGRGVFDFGSMTNLPVPLRQRLASRFSVSPPPSEHMYRSVDGTRRYLLRVKGGPVEAVYMPHGTRATTCISSQVGCRFGCRFCQTGKLGLGRSLRPGEILGQVLRLQSELIEGPAKVNVVFMGQGEPLDNAEAVIQAVRALQDRQGPALSWRRITISTVGLVPGIARLAEMGSQRPRIAVSLNASSDEQRAELMPVNRKYPIGALTAALRAIAWRPRERVTFEYVLLRGVNDSPADARRLARLLHGLPAKVNLIPWNPIPGMPFARPSPEQVESFRVAARRRRLDVLVRYSRGADIGAACGQLHAAITGRLAATARPASVASPAPSATDPPAPHEPARPDQHPAVPESEPPGGPR